MSTTDSRLSLYNRLSNDFHGSQHGIETSMTLFRASGIVSNRTIMLSDELCEGLTGNPKMWNWNQVQLWLRKKSLKTFIKVFESKDAHKKSSNASAKGINGYDLLQLNINALFEEASYRNILTEHKITAQHKLVAKLLREINKLEIRSTQYVNANLEPNTTINDVVEMRRRIDLFIEKWDKILWIEHYEETNNKEPTARILSEELGLSSTVVSVYLDYYHDINRFKTKDLNELLMDFNVHNDSVIFWFIIISKLKQYPSKSMWLIFAKVAEITPCSVAVELLEKFRLDLTRFPADRLDKVCQNIVIGSQYPVCAALRISKWFNDRAQYDVARAQLFETIAQSYIEAAMDYLSLIESDHLATVLLETKSDIDDQSALDMALEYELTSFVANNRVERVTNSIMNNFEFLKAKNRDEAFEIDPLSLDLVWDKMFENTFYFTPLGLYITTIVLYICYLALFSYLSTKQFRVYDEMETDELIFWIFNAGYVLNEVQQMATNGPKDYFADRSNYFDVVISGVFVASMTIRYYAAGRDPNCNTDKDPTCWHNARLNTYFVILWGIATITLWVRLINFCTLSHKLGPMVQMIFKMIHDILSFFEIMFILFLGFTFALMFILGDIHSDFDTPLNSGLTLFRAILGDFEFEGFEDGEAINSNLVYFGYGIMILYLVIGSLVLLNLLVAMMATTYEFISANATAAIIFTRFQLALSLDTDPSFMPPPLNIIPMVFLVIFYAIEWMLIMIPNCHCDCCPERCDLITIIMPKWMKKKKLELDEQILYQNCNQYWTIITSDRGPTRCKAIDYDYKLHKHEIVFYDTEDEEIEVSIEDDVERKESWWLDLMHLHEVGLLKLDQFDEVGIDIKYINKARKDMKSNKKKSRTSKYWLCGYCRSYVKESKTSINTLGRLLNVNDTELNIIYKILPTVCPNCYRKRFHRKRWEFVWEILSIRVWNLLVFPLFLVIFGCVLLLKMVSNPEERAKRIDRFKSNLWPDAKPTASDKEHEKAKYVTAHYADTQLIAMLKSMGSEHHEIFDPSMGDIVWQKLWYAKDAIDPLLLKEKIINHVMNISTEDELGPFEFFEDYVKMASLKKKGGDNIWYEYFCPLSKTIFSQIQQNCHNKLPLHLFSRYPFDTTALLDDFEDFFRRNCTDYQSLTDCTKDDLRNVLEDLKFLNCTTDPNQRRQIIDSIHKNNTDYNFGNEEHNTIYHKFVNYLVEVSSLFQNIRKIKNMLRDVNRAIIERGVSASLLADQLYFLFDDIRNETVALPFFNYMRTYMDMDGFESKVELWTIRNTLQTLYFLNHATRKYILEHTKKELVDEKEILKIVCDLYKKDITDSENTTDSIEIMDDNDKDQDDVPQFADLKPNGLEEDKSFFNAFRQCSTNSAFSTMHQMSVNDDDYRDDNEERVKMIQIEEEQRWEHFYKQEITKQDIEKEIGSMFGKLQTRRKSKVTETTIDYYRRELNVRLLTDDELLRYTYEQIARYITFYPDKIHEACNVDLFINILIKTLSFGDKYRIDLETIPKIMIKDSKHIEQLHDHLEKVFKATFDEKEYRKMTVQDAAAIIMLYQNIFEVIQNRIVDSADAFVVDHGRFCKFIDPTFVLQFNLGTDEPQDNWSNKTQAASNLYQSVLDIQQNFVTLGQIRQTIMKLYTDIDGLECGELMRLMNHIALKRQRSETERKGTMDLDALQEDITMYNTESKDALYDYSRLTFKHINNDEWNDFIKDIAHSFCHNIRSKKISDKLQNDNTSVAVAGADDSKYDESVQDNKRIIDVLLENTVFDIIVDESQTKPEHKNTAKRLRRLGSLKESRSKVFDTMLSFNARRITLQQLYLFTKKLGTFLRGNETINTMMKEYTTASHEVKKDFKKKACKKEERGHDEEFGRELDWLYENTENQYDLCQRIEPFWSSQFMQDIFDFVVSTKQIDGLYELKRAEFGQLKLKMKVNDESCSKLFHIIRCKYPTLSWKQIYDYLKFVIRMKYKVQKAILKATQAEDETISHAEMKILLNISSNDESKWLFHKVLQLNGSKVTWKQIISYLEKMVAVRDDMRDFFEDQERDRRYEENTAEIINDVSQNIGDIQEEMQSLKDVQQQITTMKDKLAHATESIESMSNQIQCMLPKKRTIKNVKWETDHTDLEQAWNHD